jgi:uncharacterized protein (DUF302 family)
MDPSDRLEFISAFDFPATVARLTETIEKAGMRVFARIDHAANAREVGLTMPETLVIIFGAAAAGTPVMLAAPRSALDLPLRLLVRVTDDGATRILVDPIAPVLERAGVPAEMAMRLAKAQSRLLETVQK